MNNDLLKENQMHGDVMFPLNVYSIEQPAGKSVIVDCHWHDELEFLVMKKGRALFRIDDRQYELERGQGIFINSGELHSGYALEDAPCSFQAVVFSLSFLYSGTRDLLQSKFIERISGAQCPIPKNIKGSAEWEVRLLSKLFEIIGLGFEKPYTYELQIKALLYQVFAESLSNTGPAMSVNKSAADFYRLERVKSALAFIHDNYHKKLSTRDISLALNLSEGYLCRIFKQLVKKTPVEYLNYYRVNKAARLLEISEIKIIDAAMESGFDNFSYFISTFKHHMGTTPAKYRTVNRAESRTER